MKMCICIEPEIKERVDELVRLDKFKFRNRSHAINLLLAKGITEYSNDQAVVKFFKKMLGE